MPSLLLLACVVLASACADETETEHVDVGRACVSGEPDAPHEVSATGTYALRYGEGETALTVPLGGPSTCSADSTDEIDQGARRVGGAPP